MAEAARATQAKGPVDRDTHFDVERFLTREARLLDQERFHEWLEMLAPDVRYVLPVREVRYRSDQKPIGTGTGANIYDASWRDLELRVKRLDTGQVWFEDPGNYARRLITNIDAEWSENPDEVDVYSSFLVHRNRRQRDQSWFVGGREDRLRLVDGQWKLAYRLILIDQRVTLDKNLHLFF